MVLFTSSEVFGDCSLKSYCVSKKIPKCFEQATLITGLSLKNRLG